MAGKAAREAALRQAFKRGRKVRQRGEAPQPLAFGYELDGRQRIDVRQQLVAGEEPAFLPHREHEVPRRVSGGRQYLDARDLGVPFNEPVGLERGVAQTRGPASALLRVLRRLRRTERCRPPRLDPFAYVAERLRRSARALRPRQHGRPLRRRLQQGPRRQRAVGLPHPDGRARRLPPPPQPGVVVMPVRGHHHVGWLAPEGVLERLPGAREVRPRVDQQARVAPLQEVHGVVPEGDRSHVAHRLSLPRDSRASGAPPTIHRRGHSMTQPTTTRLSPADVKTIHGVAADMQSSVERVIVGKPDVVKLALVALLCEGHILLDDVPGTGKTTLAKAIARSLGCSFRRIQFTPDLMPSDITGIHYYNQKTQDFAFREGPLIAQIVLADEINRATPRTQAALLEAMEERQITVEGETTLLPRPFLVIATQNPVELEGTFPLPEAQLDRFMLRLKLGYPDEDDEDEILARQEHTNPIDALGPVVTAARLTELSIALQRLHVDPAVRRYAVRLVRETRNEAAFELGASPRASLALFRAARAYAAISGRDYVLPDDVKAMAPHVLPHRIILSTQTRLRGREVEDLITDVIERVPVPIEDEAPARSPARAASSHPSPAASSRPTSSVPSRSSSGNESPWRRS